MTEINITTCGRCGGWKVYNKIEPALLPNGHHPPMTMYQSGNTMKTCVCPPEPKPAHTGDLGHNSVAWREDEKYVCADGSSFYAECVKISDKLRAVVLIPKEALSLLEWLQQEEQYLRTLVEESPDEH